MHRGISTGSPPAFVGVTWVSEAILAKETLVPGTHSTRHGVYPLRRESGTRAHDADEEASATKAVIEEVVYAMEVLRIPWAFLRVALRNCLRESRENCGFRSGAKKEGCRGESLVRRSCIFSTGIRFRHGLNWDVHQFFIIAYGLWRSRGDVGDAWVCSLCTLDGYLNSRLHVDDAPYVVDESSLNDCWTIQLRTDSRWPCLSLLFLVAGHETGQLALHDACALQCRSCTFLRGGRAS